MITERPWVTGGLISAATAVVIFGFIVVTQPRGGPVENDSSFMIAGAPNAHTNLAAGAGGFTPTVTDPATTAAPKVTAKAAATRVAKTKKTATAKAKTSAAKKKEPGSSSGSAKTVAGSGGPGDGRIQFGKTYSGNATFYGATGAGNCSFEASSDLMVGAMNQQDYENSQACGARLTVTGPNGKVTIRVVDRCPECPPGAIDLSKEAFEKIAPVSAGRVPITWRLLSPAGLGSVSFRYKSGSSQYWCGIQVRNHRNPVRSLAVQSGSSWITLKRQDYNYFLSEGGDGCGGTIRVTDIYGNQITQTGIKISPDTDQRGQGQFPSAS